MTISTDTHDYDNNISYKTKRKINENDKKIFFQTIIEILKKLKDYKSLLTNNVYNSSKKSIKLFVIDIKNNIDKINKIRLEILLPEVWNKTKNKDPTVLIAFFEQMADIYDSGPCAQGRTIRLIQFL